MLKILDELKGVSRVGITGHVRPDGDCLGACSALYSYIKDNLPNVYVKVYLEMIPEAFKYLTGVEYFDIDYCDEDVYDVFICLDSGNIDRIGNAEKYFKKAKRTITIDHHISNPGYSMVNVIVPESSSTCEVLFDVFEYERISYNTAVALYTGIIHDTGVLKHSNTSEKTMNTVGKLISKGVPFSKIIDESFYQKTFKQNKVLGKALDESFLVLDDRCIISVMSLEVMKEFEATSEDLEGVVDQLRITKGVEVAILMHETKKDVYKVSMRANGCVDVSNIALGFGGGGHVKAAGCSVADNVETIIKTITERIKQQLD